MAAVALLSERAKLFVGGLSQDTNKEMLKEYFSEFGDVTEVTVVMDRVTGGSKEFGFVQFQNVDSAERAFSKKDHVINNKKVDLRRFEHKGGHRHEDAGSSSIPITDSSDAKKIFVGGLCTSITTEELMSFFQNFGAVDDAIVIRDRQTGLSRKFGFVTFTSSQAVQEVMKRRFYFLKNKYVEVKIACNPKGNNSDAREPRVPDNNGSVHHPHEGTHVQAPEMTTVTTWHFPSMEVPQYYAASPGYSPPYCASYPIIAYSAVAEYPTQPAGEFVPQPMSWMVPYRDPAYALQASGYFPDMFNDAGYYGPQWFFVADENYNRIVPPSFVSVQHPEN